MHFRTRLYLYRCLTCQQHYQGKQRLCAHCLEVLPWLKHACQRCGLPLYKSAYKLCKQCREQSDNCLAYRSFFCFHYARPINHLIKAWKFDGRLVYKAFFADCLIEKIKQSADVNNLPQGLLAVPIAKKRCQERGFNQAMQLSRYLAKYFNIKRYDAVLGCRYQKQHQASLNADERAQHLKHTFYIKKQTKLPKHIALIDDVMTTGSTLNALASLLQAQGVERIEYWGIARVSKNPLSEIKDFASPKGRVNLVSESSVSERANTVRSNEMTSRQ